VSHRVVRHGSRTAFKSFVSRGLRTKACVRIRVRHESSAENLTPLRQMAVPKAKNLHFPRELDPLAPLAPFLLAGGGGWRSEIVLDIRAFLPSAHSLPWQKGSRNPLMLGV
jgi:hypothetical protein